MGGNKKCFINLYFQSTLQTCNLNTFVLENDFEYSPFLLTNLSTTPQLCPSLLLSYTFDVLKTTYISITNQILFSIYYALYAIYYALCIMHYALYTIHYALCTMHYLLCTMHYILFTIHYALFTMHYTFVFIRIHTYLLFYMYSYVFIRIYYFTWKSGEIP